MVLVIFFFFLYTIPFVPMIDVPLRFLPHSLHALLSKRDSFVKKKQSQIAFSLFFDNYFSPLSRNGATMAGILGPKYFGGNLKLVVIDSMTSLHKFKANHPLTIWIWRILISR